MENVIIEIRNSLARQYGRLDIVKELNQEEKWRNYMNSVLRDRCKMTY